MKKYTIINAEEVTPLKLNIDDGKISHECSGGEDMQVSDGYHTMDELYDHRIELFITLCRVGSKSATGWEGYNFPKVWRSYLHSDGKGFDGWFILGIGKENGSQITYHLPESKWEETNFAETLDFAPEWDGHTSSDVLNRLKNL